MKLNLGCGSQPEAGYVNLDREDMPGVDVAHDLDVFPWPFEPESADEIRAFDVFEHVNDPRGFMNECHRIMRPGTDLYIHTTWWQSENSFTDPTHRRFCTHRTWDYWIPGTDYHRRYGAAYGGHDHPFEKISSCLDGGELAVTLRRL